MSAVIKVKDKQGNVYPLYSLRGERGDRGPKGDPGPAGASPAISVSGTTITVTDASGAHDYTIDTYTKAEIDELITSVAGSGGGGVGMALSSSVEVVQ